MLQHKHLYSTKLSLKFLYWRKQSQYLYLILQVSHFFSSRPYFHLTLWIPSGRLLIRFGNELAINLALSINCNLWDIIFVISSLFLSIFVTPFSIGTENVMYFSVFSPKQVNYFSNYFGNFFMIIKKLYRS